MPCNYFFTYYLLCTTSSCAGVYKGLYNVVYGHQMTTTGSNQQHTLQAVGRVGDRLSGPGKRQQGPSPHANLRYAKTILAAARAAIY